MAGFVAHLSPSISAARLAKRRQREARWRAFMGGMAAGAGHLVRGFVVGSRFVPELAGAAAVSFGAWLAWQPSGFIVAGAFLLMLGRRVTP